VGQKSEILFLLLGQLSVGGIVLLAAISRRQLGLSFFRLNGLIFFLLMGIAIPGIPVPASLRSAATALDLGANLLGTWSGLTIALTLAYSLALFSYLVTFWVKKDTHATVWLFAAALFGLGAVVASGLSYAERMTGHGVGSLIPVSFVLSALVLGAALLGMLLGHRYLTNPHLPMSHLNILAWVFLVAVVLQGGLTVGLLLLGGDRDVVASALRLETFLGLFFWIRLVVGILGPLVLAVMILNTIRYRANMSATGLLYIAVIMVMAGEAFSRYLLLSNAILL
jgi:hypothetical protein